MHLASGGEGGLEGHAPPAAVVRHAFGDVHRALVALHGGPTLLAIVGTSNVDTSHLLVLVHFGGLDLLHHLAYLDLSDRVATGDVEGGRKSDRPLADHQLGELQGGLRVRSVFERHPPHLSIFPGLPSHAHHLQSSLLSGALQDLHHFAGFHGASVVTPRLILLLHRRCLLQNHVRLLRILDEERTLVALDGHPALGSVLQCPTSDALQADGLVLRHTPQDLQKLTLLEFAYGATGFHLEGCREGDVFHAPFVLLQHGQEPQSGDTSLVAVKAEFQLARLEPGLALHRLEVRPQGAGGDMGGALAQLREQRVCGHVQLPRRCSQGVGDGALRIARDTAPSTLQGFDCLLQSCFQGCELDLESEHEPPCLHERPLLHFPDLIHILLHNLVESLGDKRLCGNEGHRSFVHHLQRVVVARRCGDQGLRGRGGLLRLLRRGIAENRSLLDHGGRPHLFGNLFSSRLLLLQLLGVALLCLGDLLLQRGVRGLRLARPHAHLHELGLRFAKRAQTALLAQVVGLGFEHGHRFIHGLQQLL
mmetsp:Transcript_6676/g.24974  ORF Transcript_6676/g.24974 Transcript_6676/m.24974 type:complete len:534 (+) Transcript_6676:603-2204(+)